MNIEDPSFEEDDAQGEGDAESRAADGKAATGQFPERQGLLKKQVLCSAQHLEFWGDATGWGAAGALPQNSAQG